METELGALQAVEELGRRRVCSPIASVNTTAFQSRDAQHPSPKLNTATSQFA